jgi:hypothetical protein
MGYSAVRKAVGRVEERIAGNKKLKKEIINLNSQFKT